MGVHAFLQDAAFGCQMPQAQPLRMQHCWLGRPHAQGMCKVSPLPVRCAATSPEGTRPVRGRGDVFSIKTGPLLVDIDIGMLR